MQPVIAQLRQARFPSQKKERKEGVGEGRERKGRKGKEGGGKKKKNEKEERRKGERERSHHSGF